MPSVVVRKLHEFSHASRIPIVGDLTHKSTTGVFAKSSFFDLQIYSDILVRSRCQKLVQLAYDVIKECPNSARIDHFRAGGGKFPDKNLKYISFSYEDDGPSHELLFVDSCDKWNDCTGKIYNEFRHMYGLEDAGLMVSLMIEIKVTLGRCLLSGDNQGVWAIVDEEKVGKLRDLKQ